MAKKLSPMEQKASSKVLDALRGETQKMLKGKMDGIKKVTVASDSKEGLAKGLDLAKKIAGKSVDEEEVCPACGKEPCECEGSSEEEASESPEEESSESSEHQASEQEDGSEVSDEEEAMDAHQLQKRIEALMALKSKKQ